jgi:hypothetical protein
MTPLDQGPQAFHFHESGILDILELTPYWENNKFSFTLDTLA